MIDVFLFFTLGGAAVGPGTELWQTAYLPKKRRGRASRQAGSVFLDRPACCPGALSGTQIHGRHQSLFSTTYQGKEKKKKERENQVVLFRAHGKSSLRYFDPAQLLALPRPSFSSLSPSSSPRLHLSHSLFPLPTPPLPPCPPATRQPKVLPPCFLGSTDLLVPYASVLLPTYIPTTNTPTRPSHPPPPQSDNCMICQPRVASAPLAWR